VLFCFLWFCQHCCVQTCARRRTCISLCLLKSPVFFIYGAAVVSRVHFSLSVASVVTWCLLFLLVSHFPVTGCQIPPHSYREPCSPHFQILQEGNTSLCVWVQLPHANCAHLMPPASMFSCVGFICICSEVEVMLQFFALLNLRIFLAASSITILFIFACFVKLLFVIPLCPPSYLSVALKFISRLASLPLLGSTSPPPLLPWLLKYACVSQREL
jgi:hypothetical protein